jgi:hypothetical protein
MPYQFDPKTIDRVTLADLWTNFAGVVLPGASELQRSEMRKAFFAGFVECMALVRDVVPTLSDEHAVRTLERFSAETHDFYERLMQGEIS